MKESYYGQKEIDGLPSIRRQVIPHLLLMAILLFISTTPTIMPTNITKAIFTRSSSAAVLAKRTLEKERLELKKKNAEERKAEDLAPSRKTGYYCDS